MTTRWLRIIFGRGLPGLMLLPFLATPSVGATDARTGPLYLSSDAVQAAQTILVKEGYLRAGAHARAQLDEPTRQALRAFQRDHFIRANGLLDPETMGMLTSHQPAALAERIRTSESTRGAQNKPAGATPAKWKSAHKTEQPIPPEGTLKERTMPATASPILLVTGLGSLLLASGLALLRGRRR